MQSRSLRDIHATRLMRAPMARMLRIEAVRMNRNLPLVLMLGLTLAACRGSDAREPRSPDNFEVINEGSASGVTSTLGGESVNSMTSTAADTTTEFTILQEPTLTDTTGTTLADQLPTTTGPATSVAPRSGAAQTPVRPSTIEITRSTPPLSSTQPPPAPRPAPPATTPPEARPAPAPPVTETAPPEDEQEAPADDREETEDAPPPPTTT